MKGTPQDALLLMREAHGTLDQARKVLRNQEHWGFYVDDVTWLMGHLKAVIESITDQSTPKGH